MITEPQWLRFLLLLNLPFSTQLEKKTMKIYHLPIFCVGNEGYLGLLGYFFQLKHAIHIS